MSNLETLLEQLKDTPEGAFFNPWYAQDTEHDVCKDAPVIRRSQLETYLRERMGKAKYLCIAEALGYQGGHFSGIAMTSERILLGHHEPVHGISAQSVFSSLDPRRTSDPQIKAKGMTEPTATIMWKALHQMGIDPYQTVLWNALPWHPYDPEKGLLSNRTPTDSELEKGFPSLKTFLNLFPDAHVIAVGRKCEQSLNNFDLAHTPVRHPANGGAPKFRRQMKELIEN